MASQILHLAGTYEKLKNNINKVSVIIADAAEYYGKAYQDIQRRIPSIKKAELLLQWKPIVKLEQSLKKIMDYYFI